MNALQKLLRPKFVGKFSCIAGKCEDTCCSGWNIAIDKETFELYGRLESEGAHALFAGKAERYGDRGEDWAQIVLEDGVCPFLDKERLCSVQKACGQEGLSLTCHCFPRNYNLVNGTLELSLSLACPEAARLCLLEREPLSFEKVEADFPRTGEVPVFCGGDRTYGGAEAHFEALREFVVSLLTNRSYSLEDRLIILGLFCRDLDALCAKSEGEGAGKLIDLYFERIGNGSYSDLLAGLPDTPAAMLKTVAILLEYRLRTSAAGKRFKGSFERFRRGLSYDNASPDAELKSNYTRARKTFDAFFDTRGHILENYFVNYVFKTLFPLGPRKCAFNKTIHTVPKTVFSSYTLLAFQYAMLKNLLVGVSGDLGKAFGETAAVEVIQSFVKNVDHDMNYLRWLLKFSADNKMDNVACTAMLIKN